MFGHLEALIQLSLDKQLADPERVERTCNILKRVLGGEEVSGDELKAAQEHCLDLLRACNKARP